MFLLAIAEGLVDNPQGACERAVGRLEALSRAVGATPHIRLSAALSDGKRLFAVRYSSDAIVPTLYHRHSCGRGGRAVVSEPLEADEPGWEEIPPGSWAQVNDDGVQIESFRPVVVPIAA